MLFFNIPIPNIFDFGTNIRQRYAPHYTQNVAHDYRNSILLLPLEESLSNLQDIRTRIGMRVDSDTASGTDMTSVMESLSVADNSLAYATAAVGIATSTITDANAHPAYKETQVAYFALNQSKDALDAVVNAISTAEQATSTTASTASKATPADQMTASQ